MVPNTLRFGIAAFSAALAITSLTSSCGSSKNVQPAQAIQAESGAGASGLVSGCVSASNCPPTQSDVSASFSPSGGLLGEIGQPVNWQFQGLDDNTKSAGGTTSTRNVGVLLDRIPAGATITPAPGSGSITTSASIVWTPTQQETGTLDIILRDMDRCLINETADECNKYSFLQAYDTKMANEPWQVVSQATAASGGGIPAATGASVSTGAGAGAGSGSNVVNVSNPNCGTPGETTDQIAAQAATKLIPVLTNPTGGITTLLSGFLSGGGLGGLGGSSGTTATPTKC